jgi:serine/threonine protein kinase
MGEVYRARDSRLKRDVAVKVLPADVAANPERLGRFERESHVLASLNHPNIAAIYGVEESGANSALVMELVEGESLADKIARGPLPVDEAVAIARSIADALEYAHERGVIHRDLKPANVVVSREGAVKVLDFGLAKAITGELSETSGSDATHSPTLTSPATRAGVILGTAAYMAPEQARGKTVDRRADIWAFGVVLYEMLTGRRMFEGETVSDTIAAILTRSPDYTALPSNTPASVRRVLERCLDRDPKQRLRDIGEARILLSSAPVADAAPGPALATAPRKSSRLPWLVAGIALVAAAAFGSLALREPEKAAPIKYRQHTFRPQTIFQALYAQDGQTIVFSAAMTGNTPYLYSLRPEYTEPLKMNDAPLQLLSISSKGELAVLTRPVWAAHRMCTGTLARMPLGGGAPREIMDNVFQATWAPDGSDLAIVRPAGGVFQLEYPAGKVLVKTGGYVSDVRFSPDGKHIAFFDHPVAFDDRGDVVVVDLEGKRKTLSTGYWGLEGIAWSTDGKTVYFSGGTGYADFSIYAASLSGAVRIAAQSAGGIVIHDIAPNGQMIATRDDLNRIMFVRAPGATSDVDMSFQELSEPVAMSTDGSFVIFTESGSAAGANYEVCMRRTDGSPVVVLGEGGATSLSDDGRWVLAGIFPNRIIAYPIGAGKPVELKTGSIDLIADARWMPGTKQVLLVGGRKDEAARMYLVDFPDGTPHAISGPGVILGYPAPDGKRILVQQADLTWAIAGLDSSQARVPAPGMNPDDNVSRWEADGRGVFIHHRNRVPNSVEAVDLVSGARHPITTLDPKMAGVLYIRSVAVTPAGNAYAFGALAYISRLYTMEGAH